MGERELLRSGEKRRSSDGRRRGGPYPVGMEVEVQSDDDGFRGAWYEATVVDHAPHKRFLEVVYVSLVDDRDPSQPLRESVRRSNVRPRPPHQLLQPAAFYLHDLIEAFHNDGWWAGVISAVHHGLDDSRYHVSFPTSREEEMFDASLIRPQLQWRDGRWLPVYAPGADELLFPVGAFIEVSRDREGYGAAWFAASVVKVLSNSAFLVEYKSLKAEDGRELLMEIVDDQYIRSYRWSGLEIKDFVIDDDVEVLQHGGWTVGKISKICDGAKYVVKMAYNEEEMQFSRDEMRHMQIWNGNKWVLKILKKIDKSPTSSVADKRNSQIGKRYRLPTSVSPRDEPESVELSSLRKKAGVRCKPSKIRKTVKRMKLLERCKRQVQTCSSLQGSPATPFMETNLCPGMLTLENGSSVELHHFEGSSYMGIADLPIISTVIPSNTLPNMLLHQVCDINGATKLAKRNEGPEDIYDKGWDCQSKGAQETGSAVTVEADGFHRVSDLMHENGHGSRVSFTKKRSRRVVRGPEYMKKSLIQQALDEGDRRPIGEHSLRCLSGICWSSTIKCLLVNSSQDVTLSSFHTPTSELTIDNGRVCTIDQIIPSIAGENYVESNTNKAPGKGTITFDDESGQVNLSRKESPVKEIILPFSKTSPIWESIESMEVFHKMPQRPHFLPLGQYSMDFREGMAIGLMISFANIVNSMQVLCVDDAPASLIERMGALSPLEANGFNVDSLRAHLKGLLEIQANLKQCETRKASLEGKILQKKNDKNDSERSDSLITEFDKAIEELEQNLASFRKRKDEVHVQKDNDYAETSKLEDEMLETEKNYNSAAENFKIAVSCPPWK